MKIRSRLLIGVAILLSSTSVMAQQSKSDKESAVRLEAAMQDCARQARNLKGAPQADMLLHHRAMENVLDQLKSGHGVDQLKLDKAFEHHSE